MIIDIKLFLIPSTSSTQLNNENHGKAVHGRLKRAGYYHQFAEEDQTRQSAQVNEFPAGDQTVTQKAADNSEMTRTIDQDTEDRALIKGIVRAQDENMKAKAVVQQRVQATTSQARDARQSNGAVAYNPPQAPRY